MASNRTHALIGWRRARLAAGLAVAGAIALLIVALLAAMAMSAGRGGSGAATPAIAHLLRMSAIQAGLSTILSILAGMAIAWALDRLAFPGRGLLVALFAAALVLPSVVVAAGLLSVWGRNGWINHMLEPLTGLSLGSSAYGLGGILAAHVLLNGAFAARVLLARLEALPANRLKLGQSLGLDALTRFVVLDWPVIRSSLPGLAATIFLLCFTSFAIVLVLGGGPANQTFEVAIYSAVRLDFDLGAAVRLAVIQLVVCSAIILPASTLAPTTALAGATRPTTWRDGPRPRLLASTVIVLGGLGYVLPIGGVVADGLRPSLAALLTSPQFRSAAITSLAVGAGSALLTLALALTLATARAASRNRTQRIALGLPAFAYLAVPAVVLSLGFFLVVRAMGLPSGTLAPVVLILANALMSLPFAMSTLAPPIEAINNRYTRLSRALGLTATQHFTLVEWPLIGRETGIVLALGFCFSLGDLGVISLFGTEHFSTLPWLMLRALGAYRSDDAAGVGLVLLIISLSVFLMVPYLFDRGRHART
ncbi:MAG TPA: thiamine/thiamine pyrophosphate ABC transporter permease ThiP [Devosiaceae bacterium]